MKKTNIEEFKLTIQEAQELILEGLRAKGISVNKVSMSPMPTIIKVFLEKGEKKKHKSKISLNKN